MPDEKYENGSRETGTVARRIGQIAGDEGQTGGTGGVSRRSFVGTAALAGASLMSAGGALAQSREVLLQGREGDNASDPGPENQVLLKLNPDSNMPPFTDKGNVKPFWYSYDLTPKRLEGGGWTHQVTEREIRSRRRSRA